MNILVINKDLPIYHSLASHEYLRITELAKVSKNVGFVSMVHTKKQQESKHNLTDNEVKLYTWESPSIGDEKPPDSHQPSRFRRAANALNDFVRTWPSRPQDTYVEDLQYRNLAGPIQRALMEQKWDVGNIVQSSCAHWVDYLPTFPVSVLTMHDVRALVFERRARSAESIADRLLSYYEARMYRKFERKYCQKYDLVVTVSTADEKWVRENYNPKRVVTIPLAVDRNYFLPITAAQEKSNRIVFTGLMNHPPNIDAACFFAKDVLPLIQRKIPLAEFWIVGMNPSKEVISLIGQPGVIVTSNVRDIRPYVAQAAVIVVPLRYGSGVRNKILEAWGMQKSIVSTTFGAEGLDYVDGENILIADDAPTLAMKTINVLEDKTLRERLRLKGRETIALQHDPRQSADRLHHAIHFVHEEKRSHDERSFRAVIDLRWMKPGVAGGIENLSRAFIDHLRSIDAVNQYTLLLPTEVQYDFDLRQRKNFAVRSFDGPQEQLSGLWLSGLRFFHRKLGMDFWRSPEVESLLRLHRLQVEVALSMSGYISTDMYPLRNVLVVHDLQHEYHPEFFTPQVLDERKRVFGESIRRADRLIAVSEHTRQTVIEKFGIDPMRITTAHEAAEPIFLKHNNEVTDTRMVLQKYGLVDGEYLLFPGNTWPHKNHVCAYEALAVLRDVYKKTPRLVLTGAVKEAQPMLLQRMKELRLENQVQFLGYCPLEDMPALYRGASMLVYPSYFEGFGIPLVEAMWSSCPIVCSNATSLPEIAGDAALLVDPREPRDLAEAIHEVMTEKKLRQQLIDCGKVRGRKFSWQKFTFETVRVLRAVALSID